MVLWRRHFAQISRIDVDLLIVAEVVVQMETKVQVGGKILLLIHETWVTERGRIYWQGLELVLLVRHGYGFTVRVEGWIGQAVPLLCLSCRGLEVWRIKVVIGVVLTNHERIRTDCRI